MGQRENLRATQQQTAPLFPTTCLPRGSEAISFSSLPTSLLGTAPKSWPINHLQVFGGLLCFCSHILLSLPVIFTTSFCFLEHQFQEKNLAAPCLQSSHQTSTVRYGLRRAHYLRLSLSCPEKPTENGRQMGSKVQRTPRILTKPAPRRINARAKTIGTNINKCGSHLCESESVSPDRDLTFFRNQSCRAQRFTYTLYTSRNTKNFCTFGRTKALFLPMAANFPSHSILTSPSQKERNPDGRPGKTKTQT